MGGYNPHDTLSPEISAKVIRDHVEVGMKLAVEYRLPKEILEIIEQHHGSTLIRYFYHKATQDASATELPSVPKFSYGGKTPRTREAAIIMLADSVEAAVRSLPDIRTETVRTMIASVFEEKQAAGQLSQCPLTFSDLTTIAERFETILGGVYHERIQYPEIMAALQEE